MLLPLNPFTRRPTAKAVIVSVLYRGQVWYPANEFEDDPADSWGNCSMELGGDHETAMELRDLLIKHYKYHEDNITMLLEGKSEYMEPTKDNILAAMKKLVEAAKDGDKFLFFFSGHGDQQEAKEDVNEDDFLDELMLPVDHARGTNFILDNDIHDILVRPLCDKQIHMTGIFDCCHSGTIMDLHEYRYEQDQYSNQVQLVRKKEDLPKYTPRRIPIRRSPLHLGKNYVVSTKPDIQLGQSDMIDPTQDETVVQYDDQFVPPPHKHLHQSIRGELPLISDPERKTLIGETILRARGPLKTTVTSTRKNDAPPSQPLPSPKAVSQNQIGPRACIVSWSSCADDELTYENMKGEAMAKHMIDYLDDHPTPTYSELLGELSRQMRLDDEVRKKHWTSMDPFIAQRPQIGSIAELDLNAKILL